MKITDIELGKHYKRPFWEKRSWINIESNHPQASLRFHFEENELPYSLEYRLTYDDLIADDWEEVKDE